MATSQELNKLPKQFRPRSTGAVLNITTPEVQPNLGRPQKNSAKKMLVDVQEEGVKTLGKKQKKAQLDNPVVDPKIDKKMLKRGIYSEVNDISRSATYAPSKTLIHSKSAASLLPSQQARRASLPHMYQDVTVEQPSVNGSPRQHFAYAEPHNDIPGHSLDSGVVMETNELLPSNPRTLSNSLDDLTDRRSRTNTAQVQFPLSLANTNSGATGHKHGEHFEYVLSQYGDCVVCDVLRDEPADNQTSLVDHLVTEQRERALYNRDSGVGNELQLRVIPNAGSSTPTTPMMVSSEVLPSPSKGLGLSRSVELPSGESHFMDVHSSSPKEKDFFETTNDLAKVKVFNKVLSYSV